MMSAQPMLTIAICTFNRRELAVRSLLSVLEQLGPGIPAEVLVVDNNSGDGTEQACAEEIGGNTGWARTVVEGKVGLSHARNRAYVEAKGEYVAFLDDDAYVGDGWVGAALTIIREQHPDVFGGPILPFFDEDKPKWVTEDLATIRVSDVARSLTFGETLSGSNMVFRTSLLASAGGFLPAYGMSGNEVNVGEETELQMRLWTTGAASSWFYSPAMAVYHLFATSKIAPWYRLRRSYAEGKAYAGLMISLGASNRVALVAKAVARIIARTMIAVCRLPFSGSLSMWIYRDLSLVPRSVGMLVGGLRKRP
jgi:glucosyl-dolichyl phosphate glucuronosyltransferase